MCFCGGLNSLIILEHLSCYFILFFLHCDFSEVYGVCVGIQLGNTLRLYGILSRVILTRKRSSGLGFHLKDQRLHHLINPANLVERLLPSGVFRYCYLIV